MSPQPYWHDLECGALCTAMPGSQPWLLAPVELLHEAEEQERIESICRAVRAGEAVWRDGPPELDENGRMLEDPEYEH